MDTYVILSFALLIIIGFGVIMLLVFRSISAMAGNTIRGDAAERRDIFQTFERIMEKSLSGKSEMMAQIHRDERMNQIAVDGRIAQAAIEGDKPKPISDLPREELFAEPNEIDVHGGDGSLP